MASFYVARLGYKLVKSAPTHEVIPAIALSHKFVPALASDVVAHTVNDLTSRVGSPIPFGLLVHNRSVNSDIVVRLKSDMASTDRTPILIAFSAKRPVQLIVSLNVIQKSFYTSENGTRSRTQPIAAFRSIRSVALTKGISGGILLLIACLPERRNPLYRIGVGTIAACDKHILLSGFLEEDDKARITVKTDVMYGVVPVVT